jgi:hypothetical protein
MKRPLVNKEQLEQKTKSFFHSRKWKDLLVFLVFVGIATVFWMMQFFRQADDYEAFTPLRTPSSEVADADTLRENRREIPVRINGTLAPATGYRFVDTLRIDPPTVWVSGDAAVLDTLRWIYTLPVNTEKIQKDLHLHLKLQLPKGLAASVRKVAVTANLEEYAEKKIELPITCLHLPGDVYVRFFPSTIDLACYLSLADYPLLKAEDLEVGVDYNTLISNAGSTIPLALLRKPAWFDDYRILPPSVEYLIEQKRTP